MPTKYTLTFLLLIPLFFLSGSLKAQTPKDFVVPMTATLLTGPDRVKIDWELGGPEANIVVFRREKGDANWYALLFDSATTTTTVTDFGVIPGHTYEYGVQRQVGAQYAFGYMSVPVQADLVEYRGRALVFIDQNLLAALPGELSQMAQDLAGDGWDVVPYLVPPGITAANIKNAIIFEYINDPVNTKAVMLVGDIAVPYSGNTAWDGHTVNAPPNHEGAWPADSYYGDLDGAWTDNTVNNTAPARPENDNVPGDGKFDQSIVPSTSELMVGRIDFTNLSEATFGTTRTELMRRYLNKDHRWRVKEYTVDNKAIIDDNFSDLNVYPEAFAANGYRNAYPLVGKNNTIDGDFFTDTDNQSFLLGYGAGAGNYTSAAGVGSTTNFATDSINVVFSMFFGSYFGDYDYSPDPFLPAALASKGGILTTSWAGRPHWFMHHLAAGETVGYAALETQNACDNPGYFNSNGNCGAHATLLGDPTVRAQIVAPATDVIATSQCTTVTLDWVASADPSIAGYQVFRSLDPLAGYTKISPTLIAGTTFTDASPLADTLYYQVRAVKLETTPSGTFWNSSTGAFGGTIFSGGGAPLSVAATGGTLTCTNNAVQVSATVAGTGLNYAWTGPNGYTANTANASVSAAGTYSVVVTDPATGCTGTASATVTQNVTVPSITAAGGTITCADASVTLTGSSTQNVTYAWSGPGGFTSNQQNPETSVAGDYILVVTSTANGCTNSADAPVTQDLAPPDIDVSGGSLDCANTEAVLIGASSSDVAYAWTGPNGFTSNEAEPLVTEPGNYTLVVTADNGCTASAVAIVSGDFTLPNASASGGSLTCSGPVAQLNGNSSTPGVTFTWTGPGGYTSSDQNPTVSEQGTYTLTVTGPNGCQSTATATVTVDGSLPNIEASGGLLTCYNSTDSLRGESSTPGVTFAWSGPGGFSATDPIVEVSTPGVYVLVVTAPNGCSNSQSVLLSADLVTPGASASGGLLTCTNSEVTLQGNSVASALFTWMGPNGFTSSEQNPVVTEPGTYTLVTFNILNGCTSSASAGVDEDKAVPTAVVTPTNATLTCAATSILLNPLGSSQGPNFTYAVSGPDISTLPFVSAPGVYTLIITNTDNGCTASASSTIAQDIEAPDGTATGGVLLCENSSVPLQASSITVGVTFSWPDFPGSDAPVATEAGDYLVIITNPANGCTSSATATVTAIPPMEISIVGGVVGCNGAQDIDLTVIGGTAPYTFSWSNGTGNPIPPGPYSVTVTDSNGCTKTFDGEVLAILPLEVGLSSTDASSQNATDGSASAIVSGGTGGPYTYQWNTGATTPTITNLAPGNYCVTTTDINGCTDSGCIDVLFSSGSSEAPAGWHVTLAPNPTRSETWVELSLPSAQPVTISLQDLTGRTLQTVKADASTQQRIRLEMSGLPSATYVVRIQADGQVFSLKAVKQD